MTIIKTVAMVIALSLTMGCSYMLGPDDTETAQLVAADEQEREQEAAFLAALAQAQAANPSGWTDEQVARGNVAARLVAKGVWQ